MCYFEKLRKKLCVQLLGTKFDSWVKEHFNTLLASRVIAVKFNVLNSFNATTVKFDSTELRITICGAIQLQETRLFDILQFYGTVQ